MKRRVNGVEVELSVSPDVEISRLSDRLVVRHNGVTTTALVVRHGERVYVSLGGRQYVVEPPEVKRAGGGGSGELRATMPGAIVRIPVTVGQEVRAGDAVVVLEAMKTQQPYTAPWDGVVRDIRVTEGQQVAQDDILAVLEPNASD